MGLNGSFINKDNMRMEQTA